VLTDLPEVSWVVCDGSGVTIPPFLKGEVSEVITMLRSEGNVESAGYAGY
jgi:hypothetical protein